MGTNLADLNIAWIRKRMGLTQREFSLALGVSLRALHSYEQGWRSPPPPVHCLSLRPGPLVLAANRHDVPWSAKQELGRKAAAVRPVQRNAEAADELILAEMFRNACRQQNVHFDVGASPATRSRRSGRRCERG